MLFSSRNDYLDAITRRNWCNNKGVCQSRIRCISGVFAGKVPPNIQRLEGQRVVLTGRLINYWSLSEEDAPFLRRKVVANKIVSNFCLRDEVILIYGFKPA